MAFGKRHLDVLQIVGRLRTSASVGSRGWRVAAAPVCACAIALVDVAVMRGRRL